MFPVEYGPSYDGALHILLWELLSKLEKVFTVPDLKQVNQRGGLGSGGLVGGSGGMFGGLGGCLGVLGPRWTIMSEQYYLVTLVR